MILLFVAIMLAAAISLAPHGTNEKYTTSRYSGYDPNQATLAIPLTKALRTPNNDSVYMVSRLWENRILSCDGGKFNRNPLFHVAIFELKPPLFTAYFWVDP